MKPSSLICLFLIAAFCFKSNAQGEKKNSDLAAKRVLGIELGANTGLVCIEQRIVNNPNYNFHIGLGLNPVVAVASGGIPGISFSLNNRIRMSQKWLLMAQLRSDILAPMLPVVYLKPLPKGQSPVTAALLDIGVVSGLAYSTKRWEFLLPSPFLGYVISETAGSEDPEISILPSLSVCARANFKF